MSSWRASRWSAGTSSSWMVARSSSGAVWLSTMTRPKGGTPMTVSLARPGRTTTSTRAGPTRPAVCTKGMSTSATTAPAAAARSSVLRRRRRRALTASLGLALVSVPVMVRDSLPIASREPPSRSVTIC